MEIIKFLVNITSFKQFFLGFSPSGLVKIPLIVTHLIPYTFHYNGFL